MRQPVNVRVMQDCPIITRQEPQPEPPAELEVITKLKRTCKKLSARKQREIAAFIQVLAKSQKRPRRLPEATVGVATASLINWLQSKAPAKTTGDFISHRIENLCLFFLLVYRLLSHTLTR